MTSSGGSYSFARPVGPSPSLMCECSSSRKLRKASTRGWAVRSGCWAMPWPNTGLEKKVLFEITQPRGAVNVLLQTYSSPPTECQLHHSVIFGSIGPCPNLAQAWKSSLIHQCYLSFQAAGRCAHGEPCPGQTRACKMHKKLLSTLS